MKKRRSRTEQEIPLYLLPHAVARKVNEWGDAIHRISIRRTHWHHYNVTVRTKPVPRELALRTMQVPACPANGFRPVRQTAGCQDRRAAP